MLGLGEGQAVDPVGTAGSYAGYLLVEWPLPWPRDLSEIEDLAPVHAAVAGSGLRLQGLPLFGAEEARRVIRYTPSAGAGFGGYERAERIVPLERVVDTAVELGRGGEGDPDGAGPPSPTTSCSAPTATATCAAARRARPWPWSSRPTRPGWRDPAVAHQPTPAAIASPPAIFLPQGTMWAYMDADAMRRIVARRGPPRRPAAPLPGLPRHGVAGGPGGRAGGVRRGRVGLAGVAPVGEHLDGMGSR